MTRNGRVLELLLREAARALPKTRLLKLAYLLDLSAWRVLGKPVSDFQYCRWNFGPYDFGYDALLRELKSQARVSVRDTVSRNYKSACLLISAGEASEPAKPGEFTEAELYLLRLTVKRFKSLSTEKLVQVVYRTSPLQGVAAGDPLPMEAEQNVERDKAGGIALDEILDARAAIDRGEGIDFGTFKDRFLGTAR